MTSTRQPLGIRNNNPANIRVTSDTWLGERHDPHDGEFVQFVSPEYGIRAMVRLLRNYNSKYGLSTPSEIISRWAPPSENNTDAYIDHVVRITGVPKDKPIDLNDVGELTDLVKAIIMHENGMQPYEEQIIGTGVMMGTGFA